MKQIDGLVTKDEMYRLISGFRTRFKISEEAGHEMAKRVAEMTTIEAEPDKGWIRVDDRLPPYGERVLVINEAYEAKRGYTKYNSGVTIRNPHLDFTFWGYKVTHWQPLPEPPKEEKQ